MQGIATPQEFIRLFKSINPCSLKSIAVAPILFQNSVNVAYSIIKTSGNNIYKIHQQIAPPQSLTIPQTNTIIYQTIAPLILNNSLNIYLCIIYL